MWKVRFGQRHKMPTEFKEDDLVLVKSVAASTGESRKLEPKYRGPYVVVKKLDNDRYVIYRIYKGINDRFNRYLVPRK